MLNTLSRMTRALTLALLMLAALSAGPAWSQHEPRPAHGLSSKTWTPDNGNGTFTNPIFYDEFSDPDVIRVGEWLYLTGTTMHAMPGLPVFRSKDLVNWEFLSYALDKLDYGPGYRLEGGQSKYGQGIWAPALRYHDGTFYIFSNVNGRATQIFSATDPRGPWTHREMRRSLHDVSVLFDDDGKVYAVWDHQEMKIGQLTDDLSDIVPGTEKTMFAKDAGMGEGAHFYKIDGKYYIISANYAGGFRMPAARSDHVFGPYEVNQAISKDEGFGMVGGYRLADNNPPFKLKPPNPASRDRNALHQGGVVLTQAGEWWGFSMMDYNSVGRLLSIAPVTWQDGWPYFGLPGNLGRNPRTWVKPSAAESQPVRVPFERSDDFSAPVLKPLWQWNHVPVDGKWSLSERPGYLRLHALPAPSFWEARNSLTQRAIGPVSSPTVVLDVAGLQNGDVAGLGLLNRPYATLGVEKSSAGLQIALFDQTSGKRVAVPTRATRLWLRADADFMTEKTRFSYSTDGRHFITIGDEFTTVFQLVTFQGVRYALFNYNVNGVEGGHADFDSIDVYQARPHGLSRAIPLGKSVRLFSPGRKTGLAVGSGAPVVGQPSAWQVQDMGLGRVAFKSAHGYLGVADDGKVTLQQGAPGLAQSFQWMETPTAELLLMSLANHRYLRVDPASGAVLADSPGPQPDGLDGVRFNWSIASP